MKKILVIICVSILIGSFSVSTVSAEGITLFNNNTLNTNSLFTIKDDGNAIVIAEYMGYEGITTNATVKITIEKRFLLVFWNDVATWTDEVTGYHYSNSYSTTVKKGTYRATVEYTICGTRGAADVITDVLEYTYE